MIDEEALAQAKKDLEVGIRETLEDMPDLSEDDIWHDLVVAFAHFMDDDTAREWCRTQIGTIPFDLEHRLGRKDWIR